MAPGDLKECSENRRRSERVSGGTAGMKAGDDRRPAICKLTDPAERECSPRIDDNGAINGGRSVGNRS